MWDLKAVLLVAFLASLVWLLTSFALGLLAGEFMRVGRGGSTPGMKTSSPDRLASKGYHPPKRSTTTRRSSATRRVTSGCFGSTSRGLTVSWRLK